MAKAIAREHERETENEIQHDSGRTEANEWIETLNLLQGHRHSLAEALLLIDLLHEKGVLQALVAALEHGSELLDIVVRQVDQPEGVGGLKNVIALVQGLGAMDARGLSGLLHGVAEGTKLAGTGERVTVNGVFDMMKLMHDPDVSAGFAFAFTLLKGIGQGVRRQ
jgi:uncharacterized protein YjgD (DUF1641 family)